MSYPQLQDFVVRLRLVAKFLLLGSIVACVEARKMLANIAFDNED
jgi:hypothetical protein